METASTEVMSIRRRNDIETSTWRTQRYFVNFESWIHVEPMSKFPRRFVFQNWCNFHELSTWISTLNRWRIDEYMSIGKKSFSYCYYTHFVVIMTKNIYFHFSATTFTTPQSWKIIFPYCYYVRPLRQDYRKKKFFFYCYYAHYAVIMTKKCIFSFQYYVCYTMTMKRIFCLIATTSITPSLCQNKRTFIATTFTDNNKNVFCFISTLRPLRPG